VNSSRSWGRVRFGLGQTERAARLNCAPKNHNTQQGLVKLQLARPQESELTLKKALSCSPVSDLSASRSPAGDPLALLQSRLPQVRRRIRQLHSGGEHRAGQRLFEEYREWLCPNDPHSDLLLMKRLAEDC
jgi:hypothetical protein